MIPHDKIIVAFHPKTRKPYEIPRKELAETDTLVIGSPGKGKTEWLRRFLMQVTQPYIENGVEKLDTVIVCDLGGSKPFHASFEDFTRDRITRKLYLNPELDTCTFNIVGLPKGRRDPLRLASSIIESLNISTGLNYGEFWYAMANLAFVLHAQQELARRGRNVTLKEIIAILDANNTRFRDAELVRHCINVLQTFPQLDVSGTEPDATSLNFDRVLEENMAVYLWIPAVGGGLASRQIASCAMNSLLMSAMARDEENLPVGRTWLLIDEAPLIVSGYFSTFIMNCRKFGISCVLAAQDSSMYTNSDHDALTVLRKTCNHQLYFDTSHEEREFISECSLDRKVRYKSGQDNARSVYSKDSWREMLEPSFSPNKIRRISGAKGHAILLWNFDGEFSNPKRVLVPYLSTPEEYEALKRRPLPRKPVPPPPVAQAETLASWMGQPSDPARQAALEALYAALLARQEVS